MELARQYRHKKVHALNVYTHAGNIAGLRHAYKMLKLLCEPFYHLKQEKALSAHEYHEVLHHTEFLHSLLLAYFYLRRHRPMSAKRALHHAVSRFYRPFLALPKVRHTHFLSDLIRHLEAGIHKLRHSKKVVHS